MKDFWTFLSDDKNLVILSAMAIAVCSFFALPDATTIVGNIVTGLFGIAVGKAVK